MGAIKGGLILVVLAASAVRHKGGQLMSQMTLKTLLRDETGSSPLAWLITGRVSASLPCWRIALFGWANPVFLTFDNPDQFAAGQRAILLIVAMAVTLIVMRRSD